MSTDRTINEVRRSGVVCIAAFAICASTTACALVGADFVKPEAPAVLDVATGKSADVASWSRLSMFFCATIYGIVAVTIFDEFWPRKECDIKTASI